LNAPPLRITRLSEKSGLTSFVKIALYAYSIIPCIVSNYDARILSDVAQRGCDVSVARVTDDPNYDYIVINERLNSKGVYKTTIYYIYR
jgi:hypothetical protein